MKAKLRKTGEIVDIICYSGTTYRVTGDTVSYIDSEGVEHDRESLNYYWDFEPIEETVENEHWREVRNNAAIAAMQGLCSNTQTYMNNDDILNWAIEQADTLIKQADTFYKQLKKK